MKISHHLYASLTKWINKTVKQVRRTAKKLFKIRRVRFGILAGVVIIVVAEIATVLNPFFLQNSYALGAAGSLLPDINTSLASKLELDTTTGQFDFNNGQSLPSAEAINTGAPLVTATAHTDPSKGLTVTDPVTKVSMSLTPHFKLLEGQKDGNRIVYPLANGTGWAVYTMQATGIKEDIVLTHSRDDTLSLEYTLGLESGLVARLEADGSIGVYGNTLLSGDITTGTEADAELLQQARANTDKNTFLFGIPRPVVIEGDKKESNVTARYALEGTRLTVTAEGLKEATYPISIDPSIYVVTAQQFMNGNNETNINFNVDNKLIEKSRTTGARFDSWDTTTNLPAAVWGASTAVAGGYIYSVGGTSFSGQTFTTQGTDTYVVPSGVTSLTIKMWGAGGGGGGGGNSQPGGAGGGGGYTQSTITVTPGETLTVYVGGGGGGGVINTSGSDAGGGGGGGGSTNVYRSSTALAIAGGGGGGGGGRAAVAGGAGGAAGGTTGVAGTSVNTNNGGGGGAGTPSAGGAAGGAASGANAGTAGTSLTGGLGGDGRNGAGADGSGALGGLALGGAGGIANISTTRSGGGGGGAGYFGGGGGSATTSNNSSAGGGGGGGSSYTIAGSTSVTNTAGSGTAPGNSGDASRNGAADGGGGGAAGGNGTVGDNGLAIISYGTGVAVNQTVSWAKFNTTTGTIDSANPGNGACSGWCTSSTYNLPAARSNFSLVAYNGFLYAFGGVDGSGTRQSTVYIAKIGANGEPRLWHPTDTNKNNWVYWYTDTSLSSIRSDSAAVAYNNRMYLIGGRSTSGTPVTTVQIADINPTGTLGSWTSSTALSSAVYSHGAQVYNDRLYVLGGATTVGGTPLATVSYNKINSDGTLNSWVSTTAFTTGRIANGSNLSVVWGGYMYISGGCSAVNGSGYCTTVAGDTQVASINADGSLDVWNSVGGVTSQRMGAGLVAWRNNIYNIGGCSSQNTTTGDCNSGMLDTIVYGSVNRDGDASTVGQSSASGVAPCSGGSPVGCNLPGTTYVGNMLSATFINNGYLYVIGGCTNNTCSTTTGNVAYVAISSTGVMSKPATCPAGTYQGQAWCVDTTNVVAGGIAASSPVVFGNRVYLVGGLDGSANTNDISRSTINNDGSLTAWTTQTLTGLGAVSVSYQYAYARANPASAGTNPGNLYIFGGCSTSSGAGCTAYSQGVYKCNIQTAGAIASCSTSGQLQIGTVPGASGTGLGIMSGTVYANYVYLIGGVGPGVVDLKTVRYAKFDNSNNVVTAGSGWVESTNQMQTGRRRAAAFGYNGYIYVVGGYEGTTGVLADIEFIKVNVSDGSLGSASESFQTSAVTINQRWGLSVPVSNSFAYVIGGCTVGDSPSGCTTRTDVIQTFQLYNNDSGAPAGFSTSANTYGTNPNRIGASSTILNGYIYTAGGCTSATDCTTAVNTVSYAAIDANGAIGTWSNTTASLPAVRTWGKLEAAGGSLYYMGGQTSTSTSEQAEVYYGTPASGNVSTWTQASNGLPAARTKFGSAVWNDRLYVVGGLDSSAAATATVYVSPQLSSGGDITSAWSTTSTSFNFARSGVTAVAYANNLYIFGGHDGTNYLSDTQFSQINTSTGAAGAWTYSASLPGPLSQAEGFAANGYIYLMGGRSTDTTCDPVSLVTPVSANTTIASGNNPTGIGEWFETNQRFTGARYGASVAYTEGKAYIMGGGCGSTLTYGSPVTQQTALLSQPQVAKYSIAIDTDTDVYPTKWLLNGLDNSVGANWQLKYRSMTNTTTSCTSPAMTTWGTETVFGNVTLGLPGVYTPRNGSNVNTNCARFYYFNVTVDSSQAFGYPDDVTRGPTITDLTLQFTADPSKRLMHGRTFTGGLQQPIDTPF